MEDTIIFSLTEISKANDTQKLGASITYFRRYALSAIFGIASDEDIDGNIEMNIAAKQSQSYAQKKTFNESKPQPQPQQQNQNALSQNKQKSDVQTLQQTNIFVGDYNGVPLTDDDEINNEIKKIVDEVYLNTQIVDEKRKAYILKKKSEIDSKETYISFLRRMEKSIKQKIDEESKSSDIESEAKE
jgi:hypothetical protein